MALKCPIEIPLIVRQVLEIPNQFAGIGVQGDRGIRIQSVVGHTRRLEAVSQRPGVVCRGRTKEDKIQSGIITWRSPDRAAAALVQRYAIPGISARFVWPCDAVKSPGLFAGFGVKCRRCSRRL